jgi:asparagine synthase (glutamine-hydrolysing)
MCRIVGLVSLERDLGTNIEETLMKMRDVLSHGGPDDAGIYIDKEQGVALGNRRLSILDLSSLGHQPMSNEEESLWITYNGEIYNFMEIRKDLESLGYRFKSNTDTEVILKAYQEWREKAFERFIGMFAFCLFDRTLGFLYLVRDYIGIKPLYYSILNDRLIFASEVRAFKVLNESWEENRDWKIYFLIFGHIPEPFTILKDVYTLTKGSFLRFDLKNKTHTTEKFAGIRFSGGVRDIKEATDRVREIFLKSIKRHLVSDAPIGVFLSGGIDSSLIALTSSKFQGENLRTLSIVFDEKEFSEGHYQKIIVDRIRSKHRAYLISERDFIDNLDGIFSAMDQPTIDGVNTYFISRCAKEEGLKAVLSGLGGDELFGGYPSFHRIDKAWFLRGLNENLRKLFNVFEYVRSDKIKKFSFLSVPNPLSYYLLFRGLFAIKKVSEILDVERKEITEALEKVYVKDSMDLNKKDFVSYLEMNLYMQNQLLKDTDFMSMWHSVEVRVPFLDKELMEFVFSVREDVRFSKGIPKFLLVRAFEDILPEEVVFRGKQGFSFPFQKWMRNEADYLSSFIDNKSKSAIKRIVDDFKNNRLHWSRFWSLVVLNRIK